LVFFWFFAIFAFKGIGRILVFITLGQLVFLQDQDPKAYIGFQRFKKKLTDIGLFDGSSQTLD
jgi:hypothetical protein